jgi:hypothetical protein
MDNEYLNLLLTNAQNVAESFKLYYQKLDTTGFSGIEPYLYETVKKNIAAILEDTKVRKRISQKSDKKSVIENEFKLFSSFKDFAKKIEWMFEVASNHKIDVEQSGSYTSSGISLTPAYVTSMVDAYDDLSMIYRSYTTSIEDPKFPGFIVNRMTLESTIKTVDILTEEYIKYKDYELVIDLYSESLKSIMTSRVDFDMELHTHINKTLETLKTQILETGQSSMTPVSRRKEPGIIQYLIQMYNLIPDGVSRGIDDIIKSLGVNIKSKENIEATLRSTAKLLSKADKKYGFIVWYKVTPIPFEYNLLCLIDEEWLRKNKLIQTTEMGINLSTLERGKTIRTMEYTKPPSQYLFIINDEFSAKSSGNFYYIIESLNSSEYRLLIRDEPAIPEAWVTDIVNAETPSSRLLNYNRIINGEIIKHLKKPMIEMNLLSRYEIQKEELYWKNLRVIIKRKGREYLNTLLEKKKPAFDILGNSDFYDRTILEMTNQIRIDSTRSLSEGVPELDLQDQASAELTLSYYRELDVLQKSLERDVENLYKKEYQKNIPKDLTKGKFLDMIDEILEEVLQKYINRKSSIYLTIDSKNELLSKTLLRASQSPQ